MFNQPGIYLYAKYNGLDYMKRITNKCTWKYSPKAMADPTPANTKRSVAMNSAKYDLSEVTLNESPKSPNANFTIFRSLKTKTMSLKSQKDLMMTC